MSKENKISIRVSADFAKVVEYMSGQANINKTKTIEFLVFAGYFALIEDVPGIKDEYENLRKKGYLQ